MRQLHSYEGMGDRKPSQFLRHLNGLAPDVLDDFLQNIWANRLPPHIQAILDDQTEGSLDSALHNADRICEVTPQPISVSVSPSLPDNGTGLLQRIEEHSLKWLLCVRPKYEDARARPTTAATPLATHLLFTSADTSDDSGMGPETATKLPPAGKLHSQSLTAPPRPAYTSSRTVSANSVSRGHRV